MFFLNTESLIRKMSEYIVSTNIEFFSVRLESTDRKPVLTGLRFLTGSDHEAYKIFNLFILHQ